MEIKNRKVQYPNRVVLDVLSVERNVSGEISKIHANLLRDEGEVYDNGFVLDEKHISLLTQKYYIDCCEDNWNQLGQTSVFTVDIAHYVEPSVVYTNYDENELLINFEITNNQLLVNVSQGDPFRNKPIELSRDYCFKVHLVDDYNHCLGEITFTIRYIAPSTTPID